MVSRVFLDDAASLSPRDFLENVFARVFRAVFGSDFNVFFAQNDFTC
jgi:hypothetical protein